MDSLTTETRAIGDTAGLRGQLWLAGRGRAIGLYRALQTTGGAIAAQPSGDYTSPAGSCKGLFAPEMDGGVWACKPRRCRPALLCRCPSADSPSVMFPRFGPVGGLAMFSD
jgi:hypothetical protein